MRDIFKEVEIDKKLLLFGICVSVVSTLASLLMPLLLKNLVDSMINGRFTGEIVMYIIIALVVDVSFAGWSMYLLAKVGEKVVFTLRRKIWSRLLKTETAYFEQNKPGNLVSHIMDDTRQLMQIFSVDTADFVTGILTLVGTVIILLRIDFILTILMFVSVPVLILIIFPLGKILFSNSKNIQTSKAEISDFIVDRLNAIDMIKMSNGIDMETDSGEKEFRSIFKLNLYRNKLQAIVFPVITAIVTGSIVGILFVGAYRVIHHQISAGDLFAFAVYIFQAVVPMVSLIGFWSKLTSAAGAGDRVMAIINVSQEQEGGTEFIPKEITKLSLKEVSYSVGDNNILDNVSLEFHKGRYYNLIGYSGSGKSTTFKVISKLILPDKGSISLNDKIINDVMEWRKAIALVSQNTEFINDSIRNNILYGVENDIDNDVVMNLIDELGLSNTINKLPNGLEEKISSSSSILSGGEKQRIALIRGYLADKPVLLIDEVSSNVDAKNDHLIYTFLKTRASDRIVITITHKLSNLDDGDDIVIMDSGRVVDIGSRSLLRRKSSIFTELEDYYLNSKTDLELQNV